MKTYQPSDLKSTPTEELLAIVDQERAEWEKVYFNKKSAERMLEIMFPRPGTNPPELDQRLKHRVEAVGELWKRSIIAW